MTKVFDKLVRDKIPEIIEKNGEVAITRTLDDNEYRRELFCKLKEECDEVMKANSKKELIEELGEILEVLKSIAAFEDKSFSDIVEVSMKKKLTKGGYGKRVYLEKTIKKNK